VDGAHGAAAAITPAGKTALRGLERAHSVVLDPHKWLFQPYDAGVLLVREPGVLARAFTMHPEYLSDVVSSTGEVDLRDRTLELSRRPRAAKLWLTLRIHGAAALRDAVARGIAAAEHVQRHLEADPEAWEIVTPASLGIVTFRRRGASDEAHRDKAAEITAGGWAAVSPTTLGGRVVFRLVTIHPRTMLQDLDRLLADLRSVG
jgi:glutamate/tyrosine decarboxylase-like PLP-dependent enzyme